MRRFFVAGGVILIAMLILSNAVMASSPFGVGLAEQTPSTTGPLAGFFKWIAAQQSAFYKSLTEAVKALKTNKEAGWLLVGLSFAYGVFHAAGPGHGKAVISSFVLANEQTVRRGIILSFAAALAQALTAIILIGVAAMALNMTSIAITQTTRWFELGSYFAVMSLGLWLIWVKLVRGLVTRGGAHTHAHDDDHHHHDHHHVHHHDHAENSSSAEVCASCGHVHAPDPAQLQGEMSLNKAWSVILAVGLRPCTGALIVLVFALSQGLVWAGILSTLAMALGTGLTVSVLASLAVGAKGAALRFFGEGGVNDKIHRVIEVMGAFVVFFLGAVMLVASIGWGGA